MMNCWAIFLPTSVLVSETKPPLFFDVAVAIKQNNTVDFNITISNYLLFLKQSILLDR